MIPNSVKTDTYLCCFQVVEALTSRQVSTGDFTFSFNTQDWASTRKVLEGVIKESFRKTCIWKDNYYVQLLSICKLPF
jgi:hypothetical protein